MKGTLKVIVALTLITIAAACAWAQPEAPDTVWTHHYGSSINEEFFASCNTHDGGFLFAGRIGPGQETDVYLVRVNGGGDTLWTRTYGGSSPDVAYAVQSIGANGYIVAGETESFGAFPSDVYVLRLNLDGDTLWTRRVGNPSTERGRALLAWADGTSLVAGASFISNGSSFDSYLVKLAANGDTLWTRTYGGTGVDQFTSIQQTVDGGFIAAGSTTSLGSPGASNLYVVRIDVNGTPLWSRGYGGTGTDAAFAVLQMSDAGFTVAGSTTGSGGDDNFVLLRTNVQGDSLWSRSFAFTGDDLPTALVQGRDNGVLIGGYSTSFNPPNKDFLVVKTNDVGEMVWNLHYGGQLHDYLQSMIVTQDGGFLCSGRSNNFTNGGWDGYVIRLAGFSGVGGVVRDLVTNDPVPGVQVSAIGQGSRVSTDIQGRYTLTLPPGTHDIITFGQCAGRDTVRGIEIIQDSIVALDMTVGIPDGVISQSSMNIVAPNHGVGSEPLLIQNAGQGVLDFRIEEFTTYPSGNWLRPVPESGSILPGGEFTITVEVDADTLDFGVFDYFGYLRIHLNSCPDSVYHLDVTAAVYNSADDLHALMPQEFSLAAYPNPFNPSTTLELSLPQEAPVMLKIYDVTGREVRTLIDRSLTAGNHQVKFTAQGLGAGLYFARMSTPSSEKITKLLLLK